MEMMILTIVVLAVAIVATYQMAKWFGWIEITIEKIDEKEDNNEPHH